MDNDCLCWKFPPSFNKFSKSVDTVNNEKSIKESLYILLSTIPGERLMELDYGCDIQSTLFKPLDLNVKTFLSNNIKYAITKWEPRIKVSNIDINGESIDGILNIKIGYIIKVNGKNDYLDFQYKI